MAYTNDTKPSAVSYSADSKPSTGFGTPIGLLLALTRLASGYTNDTKPSAVSYSNDSKP